MPGRREGVFWNFYRRRNAQSRTVLCSSTSPWYDKVPRRRKYA